MSGSNAYRIILESKGNRFCIYYENSAIYCKTIDIDGILKETILVDSVYSNFLYSKTQEDHIYLLCQGRNRNFLLFTYDGEGWHMEELSLRKEFGGIIPLGLFALVDGIHIIYAKKLSLEYYYDVFQLIRTADGWNKSHICEMYSRSKEFSFDIKMTDYNMLHLASTLYNGEASSLSYYNYSVQSGKWVSMPIANLNNTNISIRLSTVGKDLILFCRSFDNGIMNLFYFSKQLMKDTSFALMDIIKSSHLSKDLYLVMELYGSILKISYIDNNYYFESNYNITLKQWEKPVKISLTKLPELYYLKVTDDEEREVICSIDDKLEMSLPDAESRSYISDETSGKSLNSQTADAILGQIEVLCQEIEALNAKISQIEEKVFLKYTAPRKENEYDTYSRSYSQGLKESNFKERFMKSKPSSLKLEGSALLTGNIKGSSIIIENPIDEEDEKQPGMKSENKIEEKPAAPLEITKPEIEEYKDEFLNKTKGIMKTVAEWFK